MIPFTHISLSGSTQFSKIVLSAVFLRLCSLSQLLATVKTAIVSIMQKMKSTFLVQSHLACECLVSNCSNSSSFPSLFAAPPRKAPDPHMVVNPRLTNVGLDRRNNVITDRTVQVSLLKSNPYLSCLTLWWLLYPFFVTLAHYVFHFCYNCDR